MSIKKFFVPKNIMALDWCIYTTLLLNGAKGKYINKTKNRGSKRSIPIDEFAAKFLEIWLYFLMDHC